MQSVSNGYTRREELFNALTHGAGLVVSVVGLVLLILKADFYHADALTVASYSIYGASMVLLFLASTLYHSIPYPQAKRWLKTLDHCAIFLLIAGSYTPFMLISLRTPLAIGLMVVIWLLALVGIVIKLLFVYRFKKVSLATYLIMGWLSLIVIYQLVLHVQINGVILLAAGGLVYSLGAIFYAAKSLPYNHAIWHLFVLGGSVCHYLAIYWYVTPV
ncbi:PAQR family membrane homeostasis protein TrhA [Vibrio sinus]|uniref:PAQR family membrane homeostasis protein TrhA n=1 Tax=Vibrio sinus TaxID=2946865 RepID=UPI003D6F1A13